MRTELELEAVLVGIVTLETPRLLARFRRGRSASQRDPEPLSFEPRRLPNPGYLFQSTENKFLCHKSKTCPQGHKESAKNSPI